MDHQLVGVKANRLKDTNDLEEWKTERQKFEEWQSCLGVCSGRVEVKATDTSPPAHVQELDAAVGYHCHRT